ncbi:hypothetical protein AYI69_g11121 [Smittium culicis]|uniref:Uncharacterized protein n=1 Tax=Smittium culicis TaxID=133412 RepID=A0A1R1X104_9FUNG|nr:hypothetical protein AYI69_g11121 [Smittium culicis]
MSALTLLYKRNLELQEIKPKFNSYRSEGQNTCIYCDGNHFKRDCKMLDEDIKSGIVKIGSRGMVTDPAGQELAPNWVKGGIKSRLRENVSIRLLSVNSVEKDTTEKVDNTQPDYSEDVISCKNFKNLVNNLAAKRSLNDDTSNNKKKKKFDAKNNLDPEDIPLFDRMEKVVSNDEELIDFSQLDNHNYTMKAKIVNKNLTEALILKCKELKIELTLEEFASVSPVVRKSLNEEFKVKRVTEVKKIANSVKFNS